MGEPLCEPGDTGQGLVVRGTHVVVLDNAANSALIHRAIGETMLVGPIFAFVPSAYSYSEVAESYNTEVGRWVGDINWSVWPHGSYNTETCREGRGASIGV